MIYQATEDDMKIYSQIVSEIAALDLRRQSLMQTLQRWEEEHEISEDPAADPE